MIMQSVVSSDIHSVGYDKGLMHILFRSGGLYEYSNVPYSLYKQLINASSVGKFFHAYIKGKYGDKRISR